MNINYEYYRVFYYAAKYHSFSNAANILLTRQPNVTRTMNQLESQLGCKLFHRSNRGVTLTPEGETLYSHVRIAVEQLQEAEKNLSEFTSLSCGSIAIGASETALRLFLPDFLKKFHRTYPNIQIRLANHLTMQAVSALERGEVDFVIATTPSNIQKPLRETKLKPFQEVLCGGAEFRKYAEKGLNFRRLSELPFVCLGQDTMTHTFYSRLFLEHGLEMHPSAEADTADQMPSLIRCGLGMGFLPDVLVKEAEERGEVFRIPFQDPVPTRWITLVTDTRKPLSIAAREMKRMILEEAEESKGRDA